jgi:hypothetical protein
MACQQSVPPVASSVLWGKTINSKNLRSRDTLLEGNEDEESEDVNGDGVSTNGQGDMAVESLAPMSALLETPIDSVEIIDTLGYGHNGVVFLAKWRGQKVAFKQFDVGKDGYEYFDKEVEAYVSSIAGCFGVVGAHTAVCV